MTKLSKHQKKMRQRHADFMALVAEGLTHKQLTAMGYSAKYIHARGGLKRIQSDIKRHGLEIATIAALSLVKMNGKKEYKGAKIKTAKKAPSLWCRIMRAIGWK